MQRGISIVKMIPIPSISIVGPFVNMFAVPIFVLLFILSLAITKTSYATRCFEASGAVLVAPTVKFAIGRIVFGAINAEGWFAKLPVHNVEVFRANERKYLWNEFFRFGRQRAQTSDQRMANERIVFRSTPSSTKFWSR